MTVAVRLLHHMEVAESGCWLWTGSTNGRGYGQIKVEGRLRYVHVLAYQLWVGDIPEGTEIDHDCEVRLCFNPKHLRPLTHRENLLRRTTCKSGRHPWVRGARECRQCRRDWANTKVPCPICGEYRSRGNLVRHKRTHERKEQ